jgi:hypothetical protein
MVTLQIRMQITPSLDSSLKYHERNSSGEPVCGQPVKPWNGHPMVLVKTRHPITCLKCLK